MVSFRCFCNGQKANLALNRTHRGLAAWLGSRGTAIFLPPGKGAMPRWSG